MIINRRFIVFLIFITLQVYAVQFDVNHRRENEREVESIVQMIQRALGYLMHNLTNAIPDVILGVLLTKANVQWSLLELESRQSTDALLLTRLKHLLVMCDDVITSFWAGHQHYDEWLTILLDKRLWNETAKDLKFGALDATDDNFLMPELHTCSEISEYLNKGTPANSDGCLMELFRTSCKPSHECWRNETDDTIHFGYKTTHRLFYLQVAERYGCARKNPFTFASIEKMKRDLCQKILLEAIALENENFLPPIRDLFLEQIAFCGLEGFVEFARKEWMIKLLSWQTATGCLGYSDEEKIQPEKCSDADAAGSSMRRTRRSDSILNDGCHSHTLTAALAAAAFHLRVLLRQLGRQSTLFVDEN